MDGMEARAVVSLIEFGETLQIVVKTAVKEDADWFDRFMPLTQMVIFIWSCDLIHSFLMMRISFCSFKFL